MWPHTRPPAHHPTKLPPAWRGGRQAHASAMRHKLPTKQHPPHPHARSTTSTAHAANSLTVSTSMEGQGQHACKTSTSTAGRPSTWHAAGTACAAQAGKPGRPSMWSGACRWLPGGVSGSSLVSGTCLLRSNNIITANRGKSRTRSFSLVVCIETVSGIIFGVRDFVLHVIYCILCTQRWRMACRM